MHIRELKDQDFPETDERRTEAESDAGPRPLPGAGGAGAGRAHLFSGYPLQAEFLSVIQKMSRERKLTVILSLHELDLAERISDRIACVRGDCIDRFGTPEEIFSKGYVRELYGMTAGAYDELTGSLELEKTPGEPEVFVIAGCGAGNAHLPQAPERGRPLCRRGPVGKTIWTIRRPGPWLQSWYLRSPISPFRRKKISQAKKLIDGCRQVNLRARPGDGRQPGGGTAGSGSLWAGAGKALNKRGGIGRAE